MVGSEAEARPSSKPTRRTRSRAGSGRAVTGQVTRRAGTEIRVPAQDEAHAQRRWPDPDRIRRHQVGHPRRHGRFGRPRRPVEHRRHGGRVPHRRLHAERTAALGAPEPGRQHPGHRHGRHDLHEDAVHRHAARREPAERHPAGSAAERHCRARRSVVRRRLRRDGPPGRRLRHGSGVRRGGRRQDPPRQGPVRRRRRVRRPERGRHHRLR